MRTEIESLREQLEKADETIIKASIREDEYLKLIGMQSNQLAAFKSGTAVDCYKAVAGRKERDDARRQRDALLNAFEDWRLQLISTENLAKIFNKIDEE